MQSRGALIFGSILVLLGIFALVSTLTGIDLSSFCVPAGLIVVGIWVLFRPRMVSGNTETTFNFIGDVNRSGEWLNRDQEIWSFIGDIDLNMAPASLPDGETTLRIYSFINDVDFVIPQGYAMALTVTSFVSTVKWLGSKQDFFFTGPRFVTPDFDQAPRRLRVEVISFIGDVDVHMGVA